MAKRRSGNSKGADDVDERDERLPPGKRSRRDKDDENEDDVDEFVRPKPPMDPTPSSSGRNSQDSASLDVTSSNEMDCSQNPDFDVQMEAEVGVIEKVTLQNFMCHKFLEIGFGSNVNFIIGKNGSGKSAIMTGMLVGLGGKAATTNRGNSLKGFIKDECNSATVMVKLRNRGIDAYNPGQYGDSILIERRINHDGVSSYKIKSKEGKVISTKRDELTSILDQFNIQIDNPVSILNQDTSRCFLNSSDPKDKYKFFLKATQLEQMSNHYQLILEQKQNIKKTLDRKKEVLPELQEQVKVLEEKYQGIAQLKEMREKVKLLKDELCWAIVREKNKELQDAKKIVRREESRIPKHDEKIEEQKTQLQQLQTMHVEKEAEIKLYVEGANELTQTKRDSAAALKKMRTDLRLKQEKIRKKEREVTMSNRDRNQLAERIAEIKQTAIRDLEGERELREAELNTKKEQRQMIESQLQMSMQLKNQLEASINRSQGQAYALRQEETESNRRIDSARRQLERFSEGQRDKLLRFGSWVPNVVNRINALAGQRKFHKVPVGPLGAHMQLRDQSWAVGVEKCIGQRMLLAFCCHDLHDKEILQGIIRQHCRGQGQEPPIIISKFQDQVYDVSRNRSQSQYPAVLDMLEISNPVVANALIDQVKIESVILVKEGKDAQHEMWTTKPQGVHRAFTGCGDEVIGGRSLKYYSNKNPKAHYLQSSVEEDIRQCQNDIQQEEQKLRDIRQRRSDMDNEMKNAQRELQSVKKKCNSEQSRINKLNLEIQEIESFEEEALPDLTALEEDLEQYELKIATLQEEINSDHQEIMIHKEAVQKQQEKDNEAKCKLEELALKIEPLTEELEKVAQDIQQAKSDKKYYESKKADLMKKIDAVRKAAAELEEEYQTQYQQAKDYCEEVQTERAVKSLESEISQTEKRVQKEEQNRGNAEEVTRAYHAMMNKYKEVHATLSSFRKFQKMLEKVIFRRARQFDDFRRYVVSRAKQYFTMTLSQRGYSGKLKIDHEEETLSIQVNVEQAKGTSSKDTRSLSGGERSFSTICFIMALWEAMESPFRVLDEFDVFMDMVNRRISMEMLLKIAKEQSNRQFILLTPQDMSNVSAGDSVRIYKMRDPERGQTTLPFRPANDS